MLRLQIKLLDPNSLDNKLLINSKMLKRVSKRPIILSLLVMHQLTLEMEMALEMELAQEQKLTNQMLPMLKVARPNTKVVMVMVMLLHQLLRILVMPKQCKSLIQDLLMMIQLNTKDSRTSQLFSLEMPLLTNTLVTLLNKKLLEFNSLVKRV